jgi:hypothetical protein
MHRSEKQALDARPQSQENLFIQQPEQAQAQTNTVDLEVIHKSSPQRKDLYLFGKSRKFLRRLRRTILPSQSETLVPLPSLLWLLKAYQTLRITLTTVDVLVDTSTPYVLLWNTFHLVKDRREDLLLHSIKLCKQGMLQYYCTHQLPMAAVATMEDGSVSSTNSKAQDEEHSNALTDQNVNKLLVYLTFEHKLDYVHCMSG